MVVKEEIEKLGLHPEKVVLGEVLLKEESLNSDQLKALDASLVAAGFERIDDRKSRLMESIKNIVIQKIHHDADSEQKYNWSTILSEALHYEYNYLSNLFSSVEGITLEQYIIRQKIERVKELLFYDELTLSQIANRMGFSSVAHLSGLFKRTTGFTPSELKKSRMLEQNRKPIDSIS
tara:strand:+ start:185001 stop:185534 length:534 start_codon:yes stop_codon:yes gene_type:complete